jgi:pimeloyl-ACP methyl ester carboxylesterase
MATTPTRDAPLGSAFTTNREIMMAAAKHLVTVFVLVYIGLGAVLYVSQRNQLYLPSLGAGTCETLLATGAEHIVHGSTTLYYREGGSTLVVFYHGNGGTACDRDFLAQALVEDNSSYLFVEYAGYADGRTTTQDAIFEDVRNANEFSDSLSFTRLVYVSESLGAGPVAYHASLRTPDAIVLVSPYTSISDVASAHFPFRLYPLSWLINDNFDTTALESFEGEALVVHAISDEIIPFEQGITVFENISSGEKEMVVIRNAGHNDVLLRSDVLGKIRDFVSGGV